MWFERNETQVQNLLMQNIIVSQEIDENIQNGIYASTNRIAEGLYREEFSERRVKKIYY